MSEPEGRRKAKHERERERKSWGENRKREFGGYDVSCKKVPAVSVCLLFGPSRALIVNHLRAEPISQWTLK